MLQRVAVCCNETLAAAAATLLMGCSSFECCRVLQGVAASCSELQCVAACCSETFGSAETLLMSCGSFVTAILKSAAILCVCVCERERERHRDSVS